MEQLKKICPVLFVAESLAMQMMYRNAYIPPTKEQLEEAVETSQCIGRRCAWWNESTKQCAMHEKNPIKD